MEDLKLEEPFKNENPFKDNNGTVNLREEQTPFDSNEYKEFNWETKKHTRENNFIQSVLCIIASLFIVIGLALALNSTDYWSELGKSVVIGAVGLVSFISGVITCKSKIIRQFCASTFICGLFGVILSVLYYCTSKPSTIALVCGLFIVVVISLVSMYVLHNLDNSFIDIGVLIGSGTLIIYEASRFNEYLRIHEVTDIEVTLFAIILVIIMSITIQRQLESKNIVVNSIYLMSTPIFLVLAGDVIVYNVAFNNYSITTPIIPFILGLSTYMMLYANIIKNKPVKTDASFLEVMYGVSWCLLTPMINLLYPFIADLAIITIVLLGIIYIQRDYVKPSYNIFILIIPMIFLTGNLSTLINGSFSILAVIIALVMILDKSVEEQNKKSLLIIPIMLMCLTALRIGNERLNKEEIIVELLCTIIILIIAFISIFRTTTNARGQISKSIIYVLGVLLSASTGVYLGNLIGYGNTDLIDYLIYLVPVAVSIWMGVGLWIDRKNEYHPIVEAMTFVFTWIALLLCCVVVFSGTKLIKTDYGTIQDISAIGSVIFLVIAYAIMHIRHSIKGNQIIAVITSMSLFLDCLIIEGSTGGIILHGIILSVLIAIYGVYYLVYGVKAHKSMFRYLGLGFIIISEIKICIFDVWEQASFFRAIAVILCGIMCLVTSYSCSKLNKN